MKNNGDIVEFIKKKDYIMLDNNLGSGAFGYTVLLKDPYINEVFVAKKYEPYYEDLKIEFYNSFLQEIKIMYTLNHPNIVRIYNYYPYESRHTGYIIMEYIEGKNIANFMEDYDPWESKVDLDNIFVQLIDGFEYIEKKGIVHRDIRESNILITQEGVVKIIDFGLGKTFSPVGSTNDSMTDLINRNGLDFLPNEYAEGIYDSKTDMFYLGELYSRLLRKTENLDNFTYGSVLSKMIKPKREDRFNSFSEIKKVIMTKDFTTFQINASDKAIYQNFSNALKSCIEYFIDKREFVTNNLEFYNNLHVISQRNCFEDYVQNIQEFVSCIVKGNYSYYNREIVQCSILTSFKNWYGTLSNRSQNLVLNNLISKMSSISVKVSDDYPF